MLRTDATSFHVAVPCSVAFARRSCVPAHFICLPVPLQVKVSPQRKECIMPGCSVCLHSVRRLHPNTMSPLQAVAAWTRVTELDEGFQAPSRQGLYTPGAAWEGQETFL